MRVVETHSHISLPIEGLPSAGTNMYGVANLDIHAYLKAYDECGVERCFVFGIHSFRSDLWIREENKALGKLREDYPNRLYPWATVNPAWPEPMLRKEIRYAIQHLGLYGLKFVPICQGTSLANPGMDIVAEEALALDVPLAIHDGSPEYCSAIQLAYFARKYPGLRVMSAHGGLRELWPDLIDAAAELPSLYICLSGPTQWGIQTLYDRLGPGKLMFGSDGGIGPAAITRAYLRRIDRLVAPPEHKKKILYSNAMRFLLGSKSVED